MDMSYGDPGSAREHQRRRFALTDEEKAAGTVIAHYDGECAACFNRIHAWRDRIRRYYDTSGWVHESCLARELHKKEKLREANYAKILADVRRMKAEAKEARNA